MLSNKLGRNLWIGALIFGSSIGATLAAAEHPQVNEKYIIKNMETGKDWVEHGFDYSGSRFSPLYQITTKNVKKVGLVWSYNLESSRGVEATPIVVNGVMYVTASWSVVHAIDVKSGRKIWTYDPKVPRATAGKACCDVVNRGVAVHEGNVFVASLDGRLLALNAKTGQLVWEKNTIEDNGGIYTSTGAPRVYHGKVIIGNGGAEFGVRGYITAYDAKTGKQQWRWYTVPGDPSKPFENKSMEYAASTWDPSVKYWTVGGGGTVWNSMVFDPELNLMYIGVGNASPWSYLKRSPAGGDNLYTGSVVALNPDTGEYVWHYQETPGDSWDYTSTQDMILTDLKLNGKMRKVLLHAPKNGFFFVIDRVTGKFISAENFVDVNWASGYDKNGRPIITDAVRQAKDPYDIIPGPFGGHNWHSMSFSPKTGFAYFPAQNVPIAMSEDPNWSDVTSNVPGQPMAGMGWNTGILLQPATSKPFGRLLAWDPVTQKEAWRYEHVAPWTGGTLATAGDLVFQGTADGRLMAFHAKSGEVLWQSPMGTGVIAAPITYQVDGEQYISIAVGWGGVFGLMIRATELETPGTVYTFKLGGTAKKPAFVNYQMGNLIAGVKYNPEDVAEGTALYVSHCVFCHGVPGVDRGGVIPNLGYVSEYNITNLDKVLFKGSYMALGMPDFTDKLTLAEVEKIKAFIQGTADAIRPK